MVTISNYKGIFIIHNEQGSDKYHMVFCSSRENNAHATRFAKLMGG